MHNYDCPECLVNSDMEVVGDDYPWTDFKCPVCGAEFAVRTADGHGGS